MRTGLFLKSTLIFIVLVIVVAIAAERPKAKNSPEAAQKADRLKVDIRAEIKKRGVHEWAGEYYSGDGLGVNISLLMAPEAGFLFEWHGCLGLYDRNYGPVTDHGDHISLGFTFNNDQKGFQGIAQKWTPIQWGERRYLIPSEEIVDFCNAVNSGSEPRNGARGLHLLRDGDENKDVTGFPLVPQKYQPYLLSEPIEATIISVGKFEPKSGTNKQDLKKSVATLNVGAEQGVFVGMELYVTKPDRLVVSVKVFRADAEQSHVLISEFGSHSPLPKKGWQLSTRARWHRQ